jgi:probable HAF family extracellular repeat protein
MCFWLISGLAMLSTNVFAQGTVTFTPLGDFGGNESSAYDVSADGSVVVGEFTTLTELNAFRWTATGSTLRPSVLEVSGVSPSGSVVVGRYLTANGPEAFRWTAGGTFEGLGDFPGVRMDSGAFDASADGSVIIGYGTAADSEAFRWTQATGMVGLGFLPGGYTQSVALGVSADGAFVVGYNGGFGLRDQAYRWSAQTGMIGLGFLPEAITSIAHRVSADGSVVVGANDLPPPPASIHGRLLAFRWTEAEGMVSLGDLPGGRLLSDAFDVSADGSVIVGSSEGFRPDGVAVPQAFYWTAETGMLNLREMLISAGVNNLDGWQLGSAQGVSADGLTIVGTGIRNGRAEAWVATIPEPSTVALALVATLAAIGLAIAGLRPRR